MRYRWIGGVCSGIARFMGADVFPIRMFIRFIFLAFAPMLWWVYLILWVVLPPQRLYDAEDVVITPKMVRSQEQVKKPVYRSPVRVEFRRLEFEDVLELTRGKVSTRVFAKVESIDTSIQALMPKLSFWRTLTNNDLATVKRAATEFFPQALQHYLSLPRDYAETHRLGSGQTPEEKLLSDLTMLETTLGEMLESVYQHEKVQVPVDLRRMSERRMPTRASGEDIAQVLDSLLRQIQGKVAPEVFEKVASIRSSILAVLPQIGELGAGMSQEVFNVRQTALEYLPDALEKYLSLPAGFAESHGLGNGKTARETLLEQLDLLDQTMKELVADLYQEDTDALQVHGRFLKEKFAEQRFALPNSSRTDTFKMPTVKLAEHDKIKA